MRTDNLATPSPTTGERPADRNAGTRGKMGKLSVRRHDQRGAALVMLAGEIDLATAPLVRAVLTGCLNGDVHTIEVDMGAVGFCDCAGLTVFLQARECAAAADQCLRLRCPQPAVARLLILTGTDIHLLGCRLPGTVPAPAPCVYGVPG